MGFGIYTGGTTGLTDGTLVSASNKLTFPTITTVLDAHIRCGEDEYSAQIDFDDIPSELEISFNAGGVWYGIGAAPFYAATSQGPGNSDVWDVNYPIKLRQVAVPAAADDTFTTDGTVSACTALSTPTLTATRASDTQIDLSWTNVANEDASPGYTIERSLDGSSWSALTTQVADDVAYSDTGLSAGTRYYYRIKAEGSGRYLDSGWGTANALTLAAGITSFTVGTNPVGLCEDQHGNVWVASYTSSQIHRVTRGGTVTAFNMANAADNPENIVSDGTNLYVTHLTGMTKVTGDLTGTPTITRYTGTGATTGLALGGDGYLYATNASTGISKIDPATMTLVSAWGTSGVKTTSGADFRGICRGDSGFLYANDRTNRTVYKIAEANATANASLGAGPDSGADFMDIVYDGTDLYVAGQGTGKIYRVTLAGSYTGTVIGAAGSQITGIAIGADGRVYTAGYNASYKNIYSIAAGATPGTPTNHGALTAAANWDVLGHTNGTIWVAEYGSNKAARLVL